MKGRLIVFGICAVSIMAFFSGCRRERTVTDTSFEDLKKRGVFLIGIDGNYPPFGFYGDDNVLTGYTVDIASEAVRRMGVKAQFIPVDWTQEEKMLNSNSIDCIWSLLPVSAENTAKYTLSAPYLAADKIVLVHNDSAAVSADDLAGAQIGVFMNSADPDLKNGTQKCIPDIITALNQVESHEIDGCVMDSISADYMIKATGKPFRILRGPLAHEEYGIAFRKGELALCSQVQQALNDMQSDGTAAAISIKWFGANISIIDK